MVDRSFSDPTSARSPEIRRALYESALRGVSARYRKLDRLDAFYKSLEYAHLEYDWNGMKADDVETISPHSVDMKSTVGAGDSTIPVRLRRPTAPERLCPLIVDRFTGLLFSESRRPQVQVENDDDSKDFLQAVMQQAQFWTAIETARTFGGSMGATLVTASLFDGRFAYEAFEPKYVQDIIWSDKRLMIPAGVLIQYIALHEYEEQDKEGNFTGRIAEKPYLYRRIIDEEMDLVFKETAMPDDGAIPDMEIDTEQSVRHNLGFFPGVWVQNLPNPSEIDGYPDCHGVYQMFDTIDRLKSQANRATIANCDPTVVYGRDAKLEKAGVVLKGSDNAINVGIGGFANYMEITAAGVLAARELAKEIRQNALDKAQCVVPDPEKISGAAQSAKAIEIIYAPMLEKTDRMRAQYGRAIMRLGEITLEMARAFQKLTLYEGRPRGVKFDLPERVVEHANPADPDAEPTVVRTRRLPGPGGTISLKWGAYFSPTPQDRQMDVTTISTAKAAELLDSETAVEQAAPIFDVEDSTSLNDKIKQERAERQNALLAGMGVQGYGPPGEAPVPAPPGTDGFDIPMDAPIELGAGQGGPGAPPGAPMGGPMGQPGSDRTVSDDTFNGAQFDSALTLLEKVGQKRIHPEAGAMLLARGLKIPREEALKMTQFQMQMDLPDPDAKFAEAGVPPGGAPPSGGGGPPPFPPHHP